jgi:hypothetical protein
MSKSGSERRGYRRSPGRVYENDYNPLKTSQSLGNSQQGRYPDSEPLRYRDTSALSEGRSSGPLSPRPDARRTRQLLRQQIIASKTKNGVLDADTGKMDPEIEDRYALIEEQQDFDEQELEDSVSYSNRPGRVYGAPSRQSRSVHHMRPAYDLPPEEDEVVEEPLYDDDLEYMDPDLGYDEDEDDPLAPRLVAAPPRSRRLDEDYPPEVVPRGRRRSEPLYDDPHDDPYLEAERRERQARDKKRAMSRRKLLAGAIVVGGGAVAAYELVPKLPHALETAGTNIEHQIADAFNKGFAAGGEAVRKEIINGLDTLEGVSLEGAIGAAKLTRVAYDVFVSPIVTLAATIADDFLSALLNALITGRKWLAQINADNATLLALTNILQSWVNQAHTMPKKLQTITETDLDGAVAYLKSLQNKIQEEQAKLNGASSTPTPKPTSTPKH